MTIITVMQTEIKMSAEEGTALKKSVTEISGQLPGHCDKGERNWKDCFR